MKSDLDNLMKAANLDAIMVLGNAEHNPPMYYLTGGGHVSDAALFKKAGQEAVLYCNAMERDEAAKSGLTIVPVRMTSGEAIVSALGEQGIVKGRLGVYGTVDSGDLLALIANAQKTYPDLEIVGESRQNSLFFRAMETKDQAEVERIRRMGRITVEVVGLTAQFLTHCDVGADEVLLDTDGSPLTIGKVKRRIAVWLTERGAEAIDGCIFAIGRDSGVPHSIGSSDDVLQLGRTIVFDIFPAEAGGGYLYDFTRTWTLGYATPEAQQLYEDVRGVYEKVIKNLDLNVAFKEYQKIACDEFHKIGHATPMHVDGVLKAGYVHSLGHGLGLNIHERPASQHTAPDDNILRPGVVVTIEPGLYYPEKGMGVRIEDTYWFRPDGRVELLAQYPYDFVLPMAHWHQPMAAR